MLCQLRDLCFIFLWLVDLTYFMRLRFYQCFNERQQQRQQQRAKNHLAVQANCIRRMLYSVQYVAMAASFFVLFTSTKRLPSCISKFLQTFYLASLKPFIFSSPNVRNSPSVSCAFLYCSQFTTAFLSLSLSISVSLCSTAFFSFVAIVIVVVVVQFNSCNY